MQPQWTRSEHGQVLIQVAVALVVLLGFAALAIDVGHLYGERRRMQNAADAGALAGARQLCLNNGPVAAATETARYMQENGVAAADIGVDDVTITDGTLVDATARKTSDTFIAGVIGVTDVDVGAQATAACGAANSACGLWPIAFDLALWEDINPPGESCTPEQFVVWNDEIKDITCFLPDPNTGALEEHENVCDCYDCDQDDDTVDDFTMITDISRGWMDFSGAVTDIYTDECTAAGCGASELQCQIRHDSGAKISLPTCISGERGVRASVKDDIAARVGDSIGVPLFDGTGCPASDGNHCEGTDAGTYHVTKFGCITVDGWEQNFTLDPKIPGDQVNKKVTGKAILVSVNCANDCFTSCGGTTGEPAEPWEVQAVSLIR